MPKKLVRNIAFSIRYTEYYASRVIRTTEYDPWETVARSIVWVIQAANVMNITELFLNGSPLFTYSLIRWPEEGIWITC